MGHQHGAFALTGSKKSFEMIHLIPNKTSALVNIAPLAVQKRLSLNLSLQIMVMTYHPVSITIPLRGLNVEGMRNIIV
ncbi:hypothetical protein [Lactovum miscens]|uniref:Uncharacterized protein n=1 Tax=Lactovum miscens TaxID=190387 RepID=A0A841C3K7_9LACT|nr:hypothetical protein [Lactovum miscens]MBB5887413.1 hypothetical protein [Lactovum miscens]